MSGKEYLISKPEAYQHLKSIDSITVDIVTLLLDDYGNNMYIKGASYTKKLITEFINSQSTP